MFHVRFMQFNTDQSPHHVFTKQSPDTHKAFQTYYHISISYIWFEAQFLAVGLESTLRLSFTEIIVTVYFQLFPRASFTNKEYINQYRFQDICK